MITISEIERSLNEFIKICRGLDDNDDDAEASSRLPESYVLPKNIKFGFHPITGRNILLSKDRRTANRARPRQGLGGCTVYGEKPLKGIAEMEVQITNCDQGELLTSIRIGVMRMKFSDGQLAQKDLPRYSEDGDDYCVLLGTDIFNNLSTDEGQEREWKTVNKYYYPTDLKYLDIGDRVGLHLTQNGDLMFLVNDESLGLAETNVYREGFKVYPVVDIIGKCCSVKITRAGW